MLDGYFERVCTPLSLVKPAVPAICQL